MSNQQYYRSLIDFKPEAVFLTDLDGDILLVNKPGEQLSGFSEEECKMSSVRDMFFSLKDTTNPFDTRQLREFSANMYFLDAHNYLVPVFLDFKEIEGGKYLCIFRPDKPSKLIENQDSSNQGIEVKPLSDSPKEVEKSDDNIYLKNNLQFEHLARNALNTVLGYSSVLAKEITIANDEKLKKYVDTIIKSGNNLKKLFNNHDNVAVESDDIIWSDTSVHQVVQKAAIMLGSIARQQNVVVQINPFNDFVVLSDEMILLKILGFLIEKGIFYTRNEEVLINLTLKSDHSEFTISVDNLGQDIPNSVIHFIRRENNKDVYDYKNPVLASYPEIQNLLKDLNSLDAKIEFTTGESLGEVAHVKFPVIKSNEFNNVAANGQPEIQGYDKKMHGLIVEDEKINANILRLYIEKFVNVSIAYSGNEAMNIIEMNFNKGILFNIVFMDIGLPEPWDGILLKSAIVKRWPEYINVPFIAQTAYTNHSIAERIKNEGFKGYLVKPLNRNDVLRFVDKALK